ncbi:hypothetical protein CU633_11335 [Bacillus sp. V3-13]|uniref:hypothetical protein n=1 Tax=Bacillus sp. V3-13 TaxID=2053728 RepID=UPI000C7701EF|nr:hypothetical protein [Bacillus sp. V3-13]PLR77353.1 hypothetical protein CU633_11335 [Bacillus sp. V3-13]
MHIYKRLVSIIVCIPLFYLGACEVLTKDSYDYLNDVETTDLSNENTETITLGTTKENIIKTFGVPTSEEGEGSIINLSYEEEGLQFILENNKLFEYTLIGSRHSSGKGITVGDSKESVIEKYGKEYYLKEEYSNNAQIGYFDKKTKKHIEFGLENDEVTFIKIVDMSK